MSRALDLGEPLDVRIDEIGEAAQMLGAPVGPERRPGRERRRSAAATA